MIQIEFTGSGSQAIERAGGRRFREQAIANGHGTTNITSVAVCELLQMLRAMLPIVPLYAGTDNARYQKCALVQATALALGIELLDLPAYSPNLNLIERLWKHV